MKAAFRYDLERDLRPIIKGEVPLPNFEEQDPKLVISNLAAVGHNLHPVWGYALIDGHREWAFYFLSPAGMGSVPRSLNGGGYVLVHGNGGRAGTFAICCHEKVDAPGANHSRGWHPGACSKCGLDMTIDSGD